jgi:hypothetical protein
MQLQRILIWSLALGLSIGSAGAQEAPRSEDHHDHATPYAGQKTREIKSLSEEDIEALRQGRGWGLALPAELNGVPGPAHLLELRSELGLSEDQVDAIEVIYAKMQAEAIEAGERFIQAEAALDSAFAAGDLGEKRLRHLIQTAEAARSDLRFVHLSRHLSTPALLTGEQRELYGELRGYGLGACLGGADGHCH